MVPPALVFVLWPHGHHFNRHWLPFYCKSTSTIVLYKSMSFHKELLLLFFSSSFWCCLGIGILEDVSEAYSGNLRLGSHYTNFWHLGTKNVASRMLLVLYFVLELLCYPLVQIMSSSSTLFQYRGTDESGLWHRISLVPRIESALEWFICHASPPDLSVALTQVTYFVFELSTLTKTIFILIFKCSSRRHEWDIGWLCFGYWNSRQFVSGLRSVICNRHNITDLSPLPVISCST